MKKYITVLLIATASTNVVASNAEDTPLLAAIINNGGLFTYLTEISTKRVTFNVPSNAPERTERKKCFKKTLPPELQKKVDELNYAKNLYRFNAINKANQDNGWEMMNQEGPSHIVESSYTPPQTYALETFKSSFIHLDKNPECNSGFSMIGLNTKKDPAVDDLSESIYQSPMNDIHREYVCSDQTTLLAVTEVKKPNFSYKLPFWLNPQPVATGLSNAAKHSAWNFFKSYLEKRFK